MSTEKELSESGINPEGVKLLVESIAQHPRPVDVRFEYGGYLITVEKIPKDGKIKVRRLDAEIVGVIRELVFLELAMRVEEAVKIKAGEALSDEAKNDAAKALDNIRLIVVILRWVMGEPDVAVRQMQVLHVLYEALKGSTTVARHVAAFLKESSESAGPPQSPAADRSSESHKPAPG